MMNDWKPRRRFRSSLVLLVASLVWASLLIQLRPTAAFVQCQNSGTQRIHRWSIDHYDDDTTIRWESSFHSSHNANNNGGEYQDAYGRTIHNGGGYNSADDPLLATERSAPNLELLVVCGPSGVGKGTLIEALRKRFPPDAFGFGISHTTRPPRPGEVHGRHYFFATPEEFQTYVADGHFVEHAIVHGNYYGTSQHSLESLQKDSKIPILDIDVQGVRAVRDSGIAAKYVFVSPPSLNALEARLRGRGTETEDSIRTRLDNAASEMDYGTGAGNFDHVLVNHDVEQAVDELVAVLLGWYPQFTTATVAYKNPPQNDNGGNHQPPNERDLSHSHAQTSRNSTQQQSMAKAYRREPWDFIAQSDKMTRLPSVREGHGRFVARNDDDRSELEFRARHHDAYTVDLEEPEGPRGYPKLGRTNINISLEEQEETRKLKHQQQQQQQQQQVHSSYSFVDNEEPDGARGNPKLGTTDPVEFLKEAEGRPYQRYSSNDPGSYSSKLAQGDGQNQAQHRPVAAQPPRKIGRGEFGRMFRPEAPEPMTPELQQAHAQNDHQPDSPQSYPQLGRTNPFVQDELQKQYLVGGSHDYVSVDLEEPEGPRGHPRLGRASPDFRFWGDPLGAQGETAY